MASEQVFNSALNNYSNAKSILHFFSRMIKHAKWKVNMRNLGIISNFL